MALTDYPDDRPHLAPWLALEEDDDVAITQQLRDLDKKADDIRASVASIAVAQATTAGDVKVLTARLEGFEERIEGRLLVLEAERTRAEWRSWAERLLAAAGGAGVAELARTLLSGG